MKIVSILASFFVFAGIGFGQEFRWETRSQGSTLLTDAQNAFTDELRPDRPGETGNVAPLIVKHISKVGIFGETALVIIEYREISTDPYPLFRAFSFDPKTGLKMLIGIREASWFPMWQFEKVAHFESPGSVDVVFQYRSCTECESELLLGSFHFDVHTHSWSLRHWSTEDGDSLLIGSDPQYGDDGIHKYECLHTIRDLTGDGLDDVAVRCRDSIEADNPKKPDRITKDETLLFSMQKNVFSRTLIHKLDPQYPAVRTLLCQTRSRSALCR